MSPCALLQDEPSGFHDFSKKKSVTLAAQEGRSKMGRNGHFLKILKSAWKIVDKCKRAHSKAFFRRKLSRHNTELENFWCKSRKFVDDILVDGFFSKFFPYISIFCRELSIKPSCTIVPFLVLQILRNPLFDQRVTELDQHIFGPSNKNFWLLFRSQQGYAIVHQYNMSSIRFYEILFMFSFLKIE